MGGANYMGGKRNAAKARTRDTQGRVQKGHFGRRRLEILSKDIGTAARRAVSSTRSAIDINLAHAAPVIPKSYTPRSSIEPPTAPFNEPAADTYAPRKQVARTSRVLKALDRTKPLSPRDNIYSLLKLDLIGLSPFQSSESRALDTVERNTRRGDHIPSLSSVKSITIPALEGIFVQIHLTCHAWKYRRVLLPKDIKEPDDTPVEPISDEVLLEYEEAIGNKLDENDDGSNEAEYWSSAETSEEWPPPLDVVARVESLPPPIAAVGARSESPVATVRSVALGRSPFDLVDSYGLDPESRSDHLSLALPDFSECAPSERDIDPNPVRAYSVSPPSHRLQSLSTKGTKSISPSEPVQQLLDPGNVHSILLSPLYDSSSWDSLLNSPVLQSELAYIPTYSTSSVLSDQSFDPATEIVLLGSILESPDPWNVLGQILNLSPLPRPYSDPYMLLNMNHTKHGVGWNPPEVDICVGDGASDDFRQSGFSGTGGAASLPSEEESKSKKDVLTVYPYESDDNHLPNHKFSPSGPPCDSPRSSNSGPGRALSQQSPHSSEPPTPASDNSSPPTFVDLTPPIDARTGIVRVPAYPQPTSTNDVDEEVEVGVDFGLDLFANEDMDNEGDEYMP